MNKAVLNIIAALTTLFALAGCTTPRAYSHDTPIMSANEAMTMIRVEVTDIEPVREEPVLVAASD